MKIRTFGILFAALALVGIVAAVLVTQSLVSEGPVSEIEAVYDSLPGSAKSLYFAQSEQLTRPVDERLVELDQLRIGCFGPGTVMRMGADETNLGGQCCGALTDAEAYEVQLEALSNFIEDNGALEFIPRDPYDISVGHAQRLTAWDAELRLDSAQQAVFDAAVERSHHGGPCCCKCWKWYAMSGLAKKVIVDHGWDAAAVAQLWDVSSSCGHAHDTDMHEHYGDHLESDGHDHGSHDH